MSSATKKGGLLAWAICLSAGLFFAYELMQLHMFNAIAPQLMTDLHLTSAKFGTLCSTYLLADVLFLLPAGFILDKFSPKKVILSALALCLIGTLGFALSTSFFSASCFHFLSGIGNGFCFLSCMIFVSQWFPDNKQSFVIGAVVTIGMLGGVIAQAPFAYLTDIYGWRQAMMINTLIGFALFALIYFVVQDGTKPSLEEQGNDFSFKEFITNLQNSIANKTNIFCGLYTSLMNLPLMVLGAVYGSLFLSQIHGFSMTASSFIISMICTGTIVGSSLVGFLSEITGRRKTLMAIGALVSFAIILTILLLQTLSFQTALSLFFLLGLFSSTQVLGYPIISETAPKHLTGTSLGIAAVIIMGLPAALQPIIGTLLDMGSTSLQLTFLKGFMIFPIGFFISLIMVYLIKHPEKKAAEIS